MTNEEWRKRLSQSVDAIHRAQSALWAVEICGKRNMPKCEASFFAEMLLEIENAINLLENTDE